MIDQQLRDAGWDADPQQLRYAGGARPQTGKNVAIAEWPTASGPADYILLLFVGLQPVAAVEAKRRRLDVSGAIDQAERYARDITIAGDMALPGGPWCEYRLPFALATNGRPYLRQLATKSGVWFRDLRRPQNVRRALEGWYTPQGLQDLLR
jgi:type I restriction enzyme R subunit